MDKFGVALDPEMTKAASKERSCPQCGSHNFFNDTATPRCAPLSPEPALPIPPGQRKEDRRR